MSTKPTWATTAGTTVEPSAGQKAAGFAVATRPPARWVNWILNSLCQYIEDHVSFRTRQVLTGSGTYTKPANCVAINVRVYGGGGGGGNAHASDGGSRAAGSGGGAGGCAEMLITSPAATYAYACGAGGAAEVAGGDTTFGAGPSVKAKGGGAGVTGPSHNTTYLTFFTPGSVQAVSGGIGDRVSYGEGGRPSFVTYVSAMLSGAGGSSDVGGGGAAHYGSAAPENGSDGVGYASGGSGAISESNVAKTGGAGTAGIIVVDEYY